MSMKLPSFPRMREASVVTTLLVCVLGLAPSAQAQQWSSLEKTAPAELFGEKCGMCHRAGGMGTGILGRRMTPELALLENRDDLQSAFIETVVRSGFGVMFPLSRGELSDAQLQTIIDHLVKQEGAQ
jgi:cytochrome c5